MSFKPADLSRPIACAMLLFCLGGCVNEANNILNLGSVSLGQQLIDLKQALDEGAMTEAEYEQAKRSILAFVELANLEADS